MTLAAIPNVTPLELLKVMADRFSAPPEAETLMFVRLVATDPEMLPPFREKLTLLPLTKVKLLTAVLVLGAEMVTAWEAVRVPVLSPKLIPFEFEKMSAV